MHSRPSANASRIELVKGECPVLVKCGLCPDPSDIGCNSLRESGVIIRF